MGFFNKLKANKIFQRKSGAGSLRNHDMAKADIINVTEATTLTAADSGATIVFNDADGCTVTLPSATGTGNKYTSIVIVTGKQQKVW